MVSAPAWARRNNTYKDIIYTGQWKDDKYHGIGTLYDSADTPNVVYKGEFKNGKYDGLGSLFEDGDLKYKGDFKAGAYHGTGVLRENDCGDERYEGSFLMGERHGYGVQYATDPDHDIENKVFEGSWEKDLYSGYGTAYFDRVQFDGKWKEGQFVQGKEWAMDTVDDYTTKPKVPYLVYDGAFDKFKRHGKGTEYAKDGTVVFSGEWVHGQRDQEEEKGNSLNFGREGSSFKRVRVE